MIKYLLGIFMVASLAAHGSVAVEYENWRGERAERHIVPHEIFYGATEWHPEPGWLLRCYDLDREAERLYAFGDIKSWESSTDHVVSQTDQFAGFDQALEAARQRVDGEEAEMVEQLAEFEIGRWLLEHRGLNGRWTEYLVRYPERLHPLQNELEEFLLTAAPTALATQQRHLLFKEAAQEELREGVTFGAAACGLMGDLLTLDFSGIQSFDLVGIDLDPDGLSRACELAKERGLEEHARFRLQDLWAMEEEETFDLLVSNGVTPYQPNDERVIALYRNYWRALKPGGLLVTSYLTPPDEWDFDQINVEDLEKQRRLFVDLLQVTWQSFRSTEKITRLLKQAGFDEIEIVRDKAGMFPTVKARRAYA